MRSAVRSGWLVVAVLTVLWALWEGFKWFGETTGFRLGAFEVDDRTLPHLHDIVGELFEPSRRNGPLLIDVLLDAAVFTAKEAAAGCPTSSPRRPCRSSPSRPWSSSGSTRSSPT